MSRLQWNNNLKTPHRDWENLGIRDRFSDKTDDPEAKDHDEATEIFFSGIKLARSGDIKGAGPQIACAFLLDSRSINYTVALPPGLTADQQNKVLDYELMRQIAQSDPNSFACGVVTIMFGHYLGSDPQHGQKMIAAAMMVIEQFLEFLYDNPHVENPENGILGGCLTRPCLLRQRSTFHMAMGNRKKAMKDLSKALKINEFYTTAREARACVWAAAQLKDDKTIHGEFKRVISEVHEDNRGNEVAYGWLALTTLNDPSLGSIDEAKVYYDKCLKATVRRDEIYGKRSSDRIPDIIQVVHGRFQQHPRALEFNRDLHDIIQGMRDSSMEERLQKEMNKNKHSCVKCGALRNSDGGAVMKCSRCKNVSYCSRDCQISVRLSHLFTFMDHQNCFDLFLTCTYVRTRVTYTRSPTQDWKNHKAFCKMVKNMPKSTASTKSKKKSSNENEESPSRPEDNVAKESMSDWDGNVTAAKRMELELGETYQKYGKGFAQWWDEMTFNEKKELLLDVTYCSIPLTTPSHDEIRDKLSTGVISRALFDYNIETLCGSCKCTGSCEHYFNGKLLHEIHSWANSPHQKEFEDIKISSHMKDIGIFPDMFEGSLAIVVRPGKGETMGNPMIFTDEAPADTIQQTKDYMKQGLVYDASSVHFATTRKIFGLCLLIKLFDEYQYKIRRQPSINPMERLMGCVHCRRSCQVPSAKKCPTCTAAWFCCEGCMVGAGHKRCPQNEACDSKAIFR